MYCMCRGYPTPHTVNNGIIETEKENNNNKAVGQVFVLTQPGFFLENEGQHLATLPGLVAQGILPERSDGKTKIVELYDLLLRNEII